MKREEGAYKKLVLVCENSRDDGRECCHKKGGAAVRFDLKQRLAAVDPAVRVSRTGCMGKCSDGAIVVLMPDNLWFTDVTPEDIDEIFNEIIKRL